MYELIQHQRLATAASSITFSSIPNTFTDLYLVFSLRNTNSSLIAILTVNGSQSNLSSRGLDGTGSSTYSFAEAAVNPIISETGYTANTFGNGSIYIPNYTSSNNKSISVDSVTENNAANSYQRIVAGLWSSSSVINALSLVAPSTFAAGSSATLYGINRTQAIGKPKAIGGNITYANGYWVHTFTGSGTFYAQEQLSLECLVIGGGGGGGGRHAGGGGAGGYRESSFTAPAYSSYAVIVGAGGTGAPNGNLTGTKRGVSGSDSSFSAISSAGGGGGGGAGSGAGPGLPGGSGGGGSADSAGGTGNTPSVSPSQGNNGGAGVFYDGSSYVGGGGGGASSAGGTRSGSTAGAGGAGSVSYITGTAVTRAGGGGGGAWFGSNPGAGGAGGGGGGSGFNDTFATNGTASTGGGGGGGGGENSSGGNGGSGVVIVRYRA